ncbi:MAG: TMEM175 family protein [Omnitrophica WOR_2 bacterium]
MQDASGELEGRGETRRIEAFSDGVFAVAITLLVLGLHVPDKSLTDHDLLLWLLGQWPVYFAFVTSFATIGVMWINHHRMFTHIQRADTTLLSLNLLLLLLIVFVPFPTLLLADYIILPGQHLAALLYSGTYILLAICFNLIWRYATNRNRLMGKKPDMRKIQEITAQYRFGPVFYIFTFLLAWLSAPISLAVNLLVALFFALPGEIVHLRRDALP